ncbi:MAG: pyrimidine reductase [Naasia sp.]|jgi:riboflavin biosynthesis pyrimidine reductase|uniref:dihydrofolate reductase family protein n=1 Tax=Naasia sp. TaxID=2546198 RepID=UPI0026279623|nr:dihydrofolate reductase family protein [Naasia sp.]MCU1571175.1 pyrimidine reductase [Naasia sp.]
MTVLTRLIPGAAESRDSEDPGLRDWLREVYALESPGTVRLNFVASLNGSAVGEDGTSESLSSRLDRTILGVVRRGADVVVVGARTVRREGYISPRHSRLAVVTRSGHLGGHRLAESDVPPLILGPPSALARAAEELAGLAYEPIPLQSDALDPVEVLAGLRAAGLSSVVCEGGPTLAAAFLDAGLVDELCLTTAPKLRAPGLPLFPRLAETHSARLASLLADEDGYLYARWSLASV